MATLSSYLALKVREGRVNSVSMNASNTTQGTSLWHEALPSGKSWASLWSDYIICGRCGGIRLLEGACGVCGDPLPSLEPQVARLADGREIQVTAAFAGAEGRYEDWVYLKMMEREWKRPVLDSDRFSGISSNDGPSPRASIVLLFWSYFETRIDRLLRAGLQEVPQRLLDDTLRRYSSIGARMSDFYRIAFGSTYKEDLEEVGHGQVWLNLAKIQERRNLFAHGQPQAIDDALVRAVVEMIKVEHEAWIAVFNKRAARTS